MTSFVDRCIFRAQSAGLGDFVVAAAVLGYLTPTQANAVSGSFYHYVAETRDSGNIVTSWELGGGFWNAGTSTLSRFVVLFSSNSNAKVNFSSAPQVMLTVLAEDLFDTLPATQISNIPSGIITATDVQAALNQLAAAIPSPGPGTDPLTLLLGLQVLTNNPTGGGITDRRAASISLTTDVSNVDPSFSNTTALSLATIANNGQQNYNPVTQTKESFFTQSNLGLYSGAGQRFLFNNQAYGYGMGDIAIHGQDLVQYAGGPTAGDEGQGWGLVSRLTQQNHLNVTTLFAVPTPSVVNTVTTQAIIKSKDPQTVNVASTAGAVNDDWVVIEQMAPTDQSNTEAVKILSFTPTSITGVFRCNHNNGVTVTPALVLHLSSTTEIGQERVLINKSQPSYSTGTITAITGGGLTGSATGWTENMVGGYHLNIGAISLDADDYTGSPIDQFTALNPCKSWYQLYNYTSPTSIGLFTTSVAGDLSYRGKGPPPSGSGAPGNYTYIIRPCAKILTIETDANANKTGRVICETSTSTWTVGDTVEQVICPYPDVTGFTWTLTAFTNGGTYRSFMEIRNLSPRTFSSCFTISDVLGAPPAFFGPTADLVTWGTIFNVTASCNIGMTITGATTAAIQLPDGTGGNITWGAARIGADGTTNHGLQLYTLTSLDVFGKGYLSFLKPDNGVINPLHSAVMEWGGSIHLKRISGVTGELFIDNDFTDPDYERGFARWNSNVFEIGTEKFAGGTARDLVIKTNTVEQLRFIAGSQIKFTAAANFSANGAVATALTNVGPAGSHTTVQKWLTIVDDTGATVYIPCF